MKIYTTALHLICASGIAVASTAGQDLQAITDGAQRVEIPGLSILPPPGGNWFLFPVSPQEQVPRESLIRFVKRSADVGPGLPDDPRVVSASAIVIDLGGRQFATPAEFLEHQRKDMRAGDMVTQRQRLIEFEATLDNSVGATCVRARQLTEIVGVGTFRGATAMNLTHRLYCLHPQWPQYAIDVAYSQQYRKDRRALPLDPEAEVFLKGLVFTASRPVAVPTLGASVRAGVEAYDRQRWSEAEAYFQAALREAENVAPKTPLLATTLYYLASVQQKQGRPAEAEPLFERALSIWKEHPDADGRLYAQTLNDLASIYANRGELETAEPLFRRALEVRETTLGPDHVEVAQSLSNLLMLYRDLNRLAEAELVGRRALAIIDRTKGTDDPGVVGLLNDLAYVYLSQGKFTEAEPVVRRFLSFAEKANDPKLADHFDLYAQVLRKLGREAEAIGFEARARSIRGN